MLYTGNNKKTRNSSFELVKIIGIICIVFCHSIPTERIEYHFATNDPWLFGLIILRQLGSIGNAIFMVSSAWFLVDIHVTDLKKIKNMIANNQIISLLFLAILWGYATEAKIIIKQLFPFLFSTLWYVTCYVIYYCVHELINKSVDGIRTDFRLAAVILIVIDCIVFAFGGLFFNELIGFILIHVFTWFLKKQIGTMEKSEVSKLGWKVLSVSLVGWFFGAVILNILGIKYPYIGSKMQNWNRFYNPFILGIAYGFIMLASSMIYKSSLVNKISSLSLYIYMITGNQMLRMYPDNILYDVIKNKFGTSMKVCFCFVVSYTFFKLIIGSVMASFYKLTVAKGVSFVVDKECSTIKKYVEKYFPKAV